jgi:hypothetical protein
MDRYLRPLFALLVSFVVAGLFLSTTLSPSYAQNPQPPDLSTPEKALDSWVSVVSTQPLNPENVAALYTANALLFPTFSPTEKKGTQQIKAYFEKLKKDNPELRVELVGAKLKGEDEENTLSGFYTFSYRLPSRDPSVVCRKSIPARYTFKFKNVDATGKKPEWRITTHHSSVVPQEPQGGAPKKNNSAGGLSTELFAADDSPCSEVPTTTPTQSPTPTVTATVTTTPTETATITATTMETAIATSTAVATATATETATETSTAVATATTTETAIATSTAVATATTRETATETSTAVVTATATVTATETSTAVATATATETATETSTAVVTATATVTVTDISTTANPVIGD